MRTLQMIRATIALIALTLASACISLKSQPTIEAIDAAAILTQAAQTVIARLVDETMVGAEEKTQAAQTGNAVINLAVTTVAANMTLEAETKETSAPATPTPTPNATPSVTPAPLPPPPIQSAYTNCDRADFVADLSPVSDSIYYPGEVFNKIWRLQNVGYCTWTPDYSLVMVNGEFQGGVSRSLPNYVRPGQTIDISLGLVAPYQPGSYIGYWNLRNSAGQYFGFGPLAQTPITVQALVVDSGAGYSFDFSNNYCRAEWRTGAGVISCSGIDDEDRGLVILLDYPILENGAQVGPGLWTHPNNKTNGWISGAFPPVLVRYGDHFKAKLGCLAASPGCDVLLQVEYEIMDGPVATLGQWHEVFDAQTTNINVDLSSLAGQYVKFIFTVNVQNNQPGDANGVWLFPRIGP
jgi:hypothetical protein